jgi:hypothetical protein
MCHIFTNNPIFISALIDFDSKESARLQSKGCSDSNCEGHLNVANYPRKPKDESGHRIPGLELRLSFCCNKEGCRKRHTPASICFLGRRVYLGIVVVLACALEQGLTSFREKYLSRINISRQVLHDWITWWREVFTQTSLWKTLKANFIHAEVQNIPLDPMTALPGTVDEQLMAWLKHLRFVSTTPLMQARVEKATQSF